LRLPALLAVAAAILAGALVLARTHSLRQALPVLLDLLTAAGLLGLVATPAPIPDDFFDVANSSRVIGQ
jgi:hypothetical protein